MLAHEKGEPMGITVDRIVRIESGSNAEGKVEIGDRILEVNDWKVKNVEEFWERINLSFPVVVLKMRREMKTVEEELRPLKELLNRCFA